MLLGATSVVLGLLLAHKPGSILDGPPTTVGPIFSLAAAAGLLSLCACIGAALLARAGGFSSLPAGTWLGTAVAVGACALATCFLVLGVSGLLSAWALGLTMAIAFSLTASRLQHVARALHRAIGELLRTASALQLRWVPVLGTLTFAPFVVASLLPPTDWDTLMYHIRVPLQFLASQSVFLPGDNLHFGYLGPIQFLYLPLLAAGALSGPATLNMGFAALLALAIFDLGRTFVSEETGQLAHVLIWASSSLLLVASTARVDTALSLFLTLGLVALESRLHPTGKVPSFLIVGLLLGGAVAVKASAALFLPCLLATYFWSEWRLRPWRAGFASSVMLLVAGGSIALAPWLLKNTALMGYPLGLLQMRSRLDPWLAELLGSASFPPGMPALASRALVTAREPFNPVAFFLHPGSLTIEAEGSLYFPGLLFLALPLLAFLPRSRPVLRMLVTSLGFACAVIFYRPATNLRYLIPALTGITIASAYLLEQVSTRVVRAPMGRRAFLMIVVVLSLVPTWAAGAAKLRANHSAWQYLGGRVSTAAYVVDPQNPLGGYGPIVEAVNSTLPLDATVLLLLEARSTYLQPRVLQDNRLLNWPALVPLLKRDPCLSGVGFTHMIVNEGAMRLYAGRGVDPANLGWDLLGSFAERCLVELARTESHTLYELRMDPAPTG